MKSSGAPAHSITGWLRRDGRSGVSSEPGSCWVTVSTGRVSATPLTPGKDGASFRPSQAKAWLKKSGKVSDSLLAP
jgi:hypothetical protein